MARNEEKSQSMLHRYLRSQSAAPPSEKRRPHLATLCDDVDDAQHWHAHVIRDITRRVSEIQNPGLDGGRVRDLNDAINKLLRERGHWERRVAALGGPDVAAVRRRLERDGRGAADGALRAGGVLYFGEARNLPEARDAVAAERARREEAAAAAAEGVERAARARRVDAAYFGFVENEVYDSDGGGSATFAAGDGGGSGEGGNDHARRLLDEERVAETTLRERAAREWERGGGTGGVDDEWDESYLQFVGVAPGGADARMEERLALQARKAEALAQLEAGLRKRLGEG